jgi:hypothetical protein
MLLELEMCGGTYSSDVNAANTSKCLHGIYKCIAVYELFASFHSKTRKLLTTNFLGRKLAATPYLGTV